MILAFQKFFQNRGTISVPNFIIFDQPSQVYFPQLSVIKAIDDSEAILDMEDEDKLAVRKIFSAMSGFLASTKSSVQIIVTEHADEDIWGDIPTVNLVEKWRGGNQKLIPVEWLD